MKTNLKVLLTIILIIFISPSIAKTTYSESDFTKFDATGICPGCDLSGAYFSKKSHHNANLFGANLTSASLFGMEIWESDFTNAQMMNGTFEYMRAAGSKFINANLSYADLATADLSNSDFTGANITGANLARADLTCASISQEQLAQACSLSGTIMPNGDTHPQEAYVTNKCVTAK